MSKLYVVATPIGNLQDASTRSLNTLKNVDLILAEDTRVAGKLLNYFNIDTPVISYHQHSKLSKVKYIIEQLQQGKDIALVSDAGTPGISDPGNKLIAEIIKLTNTCYESHGRISKYSDIEIIPIPGASAVTAAASISGFPMDKFLFLGFPPAKRKRKKFFEEVFASKYPVIIFESTHRIIKTLNELSEISKYKNIEISLVVCRELTKKFETIYRGAPEQVISQLKKTTTKGEFVVVVKMAKRGLS